MSSKPRLFSGMQPSAESLHIGNYIGALLQWKELQNSHDAIFCIVDLHAITVAQDPAALRENTRRTAAQYIAAGIDPQVSTLFVQSHVAAHPQLAWVLNTITGFGEASRMTQFKDKGGGSVGLFTYPVLQAADILMYQADSVPIGEDQRQHLELTRDLAQRFNSRFGDTFRVPGPYVGKQGARIKDLQDPTRKMSKGIGGTGTVWVLDEPGALTKKVKGAVTDTGREVVFDVEAKPGVSNLLTVLSAVTDRQVPDLEGEFAGRGYGDLKVAVAEAVVAALTPVRERYAELIGDPAELDRLLADGAERAREVAVTTMTAVRERVGLLAPLR